MVHSAEAHPSCYQAIAKADKETHTSADWVLCYIVYILVLLDTFWVYYIINFTPLTFNSPSVYI